MARITKIESTRHRAKVAQMESTTALLLSVLNRNGEGSLFSPEDTTAGTETELQAAVQGSKSNVDLPLAIEESNYFANVLRRAAAGDTPRKVVDELGRFLKDHENRVWENSWVRFSKSTLGRRATDVLHHDLLADKTAPENGLRSDTENFSITKDRQEYVRVPISYLIKLALADVVDGDDVHPFVLRMGQRLLGHFLSDNTSPETHSFCVVRGGQGRGPGTAAARETGKRFLLTQLLAMYGNEKFMLTRSGQKALTYFSPHPPVRQRELNDCISDSFYRDLFMSPCLSGWNKGEAKQGYMRLCHEVLSRSQLNAVAKLHDAGIIANNLVVLPNASNISLANNGTHVSLGSRALTSLREDPESGFGALHEKHLGDLVIKIVEHFLPLFVKTYSAAPYRFAFGDFHPERVLGFLPHELDYTHLRMLWRRWKAKAGIKFFGQPVTPFGPPWLDGAISGIARLKGDFVPDFRLIDYPVGLLSTEKSPALNGVTGNGDTLKKDLAALGVFDTRMSLYLPFKLREFEAMGFCGFEGRHYSLFPTLRHDMGRAVDLQHLVTAFAYNLILHGQVTHRHIPDSPFVESERRQIFFGAAIGVPTFFVRLDTDNLFLTSIIEKARNVRTSRRYPGYVRVHNVEYCRALVRLLEESTPDFADVSQTAEVMADLRVRIEEPGTHSSACRLTEGILRTLGTTDPLRVGARHFNRAAEEYYRGPLRFSHISEGLDFLEEDLERIASPSCPQHNTIGRLLYGLVSSADVVGYVRALRRQVMTEEIPIHDLRRLIFVVLLTVYADEISFEKDADELEETGT